MTTPGVGWRPPPPPPAATPGATPVRPGSFGVGFARPRSATSRWYLAPMLGIVALVAGLAVVAFARAPVPPGVDPGHWLSISYAYVGLPSAPDPTDQVMFYSPLMFPFLGGLVLATGNPLLAADLFAIGLFVLFGLSVVHLARRFVVAGPFQVALVGLTVLSGASIQMLFWGGYPNLLGFVLMNETLIALLAFVRTERTFDGAVFYLGVGLTFFAHDLSFTILAATIAVVGLLLLCLRRISLRFLVRPVNVAGVVGLVAVIEGYNQLTARLGISHADYIGGNPSAYYIDQVGELFAPLAHAPLLAPMGPPVYLPALPTAIALASAPVVALGALLALRRLAPGRVDRRLVIATGWLAAALAVPGVGYLAHVDTDYTRFLYFLPLPFYLVVLLAIERLSVTSLLPAPHGAPPGGTAPGEPSVRRRRRPAVAVGPTAFAAFAVAVVLGGMIATVTVPTIEGNEVSSTATAHDTAFLQAMQWLHDNRTSGSVLTVPSTARWTEALSNRDALTVGPVWLLFDAFQITDSQEAYWAFTSQYVLLGPQGALSFSGFATPVMSQAPMYTAYVHGLPFPVARLLPGSFALNATGPNGTGTYPLSGGTGPGLAGPAAPSPNATVTYNSSVATVRETSWMEPDGSARVVFTVEPRPGATVAAFDASIAGPPPDSTILDRDTIAGTRFAPASLTIRDVGHLGQSPTPAEVDTTVAFAPAPRWVPSPVPVAGALWNAQFPDPNGSRPFEVVLAYSSVGASYPGDALPTSLSTVGFLDAHAIRFLLWPTHLASSIEVTYYETTFGFRPAYQNAEWVILAR